MQESQPRVLFVYFTYTKQTLKVVEAMTEVFRARGCDDIQDAQLETARTFASRLADRQLWR